MALVEDDQALMLAGAVLGLILLPTAMAFRIRAFMKRHDLSTELVPALYERLVWLRALLDFTLCLTIFVGCLVRRAPVMPRGVPTLLGFLFQFEETAMLWLMNRTVVVPHRYLCKKEDASENEVFLVNTLKGLLAVGLVFSIPPLAANLYGFNGLYFWFRDHTVELLAFWWISYAEGLTCVVISVLIVVASYRRQRHARQFVHYGPYFAGITVELAVLFLMENLCWGFPYYLRSISFTYSAVTMGGRPRWCRMFDIYAIGFRGAVDAAAFAPKDGLLAAYRFLRRVLGWVRRTAAAAAAARFEDVEVGPEGGGGGSSSDGTHWHDALDGSVVKLMMMGKTKPLPFFTDLPRAKMEDRRMFVTTFNCGECPLEAIVDDIPEWIPKDMPVYVIGVQECMIQDALKEAILDHVGRDRYMCWDDAIGSTVTALGFHGMIAVFVLARVEDVRAGYFMIHESQQQRIARGKNLGVTRAQNKGSVGLAFRYHDMAIGCVCVHLASDSKGRSKLSKRLKDAHDMLFMTSLWKERYKGVDLQYQQHLTIFLGDMNFRMRRTSPRRVMEDLAHICRREKEERYGGREDWRRLAYSAVLSPEGQAYRPADGDDALALMNSLGGGFSEEESIFLGRSEADSRQDKEKSGFLHRAGDEEKEEERPEDDDEDLEDEEEDDDEDGEVIRFRKPRLSLILAPVRSSVRVTWQDFLRSDELQRCMHAQDVFYNYFEGEIRFPPSYRRIRGEAGDCRDYTDPSLMLDAYSVYVKDKSILSSILGKDKKRKKKKRLKMGRGSSITASTLSTLAAAALSPSSSSSAADSSSVSTASGSGGSGSGGALSPAFPELEAQVSEASHPSTHSSSSGASSPKSSSFVESAAPPPPTLRPSATEASGKSTRIPSYTDRILLNVQPDRRSRVRLDAYEACDAITCSDHKPVSSIITLSLNTGLTGLGSFLPMIQQREDDEDEEEEGEDEDDDEEAAAAPALAAAATSSMVGRPAYTVCTVSDAAFYMLTVTDVTADFTMGCERGLFSEAAAASPSYCAVQCPLSFEDPYRDLRRPAYTAQITRQMIFLTAEERVNPFAYFSLQAWGDIRRRGVTFVTCLRPEWGMRAGLYVRSGRVTLGSAMLPLTDAATGMPLAYQEGLRVPTTRGGIQTGFFTCTVRLVQLAVPPKRQPVFA